MSVLAAFDTPARALDFVAEVLECTLAGVDTPLAAVFDIDDTMLMDPGEAAKPGKPNEPGKPDGAQPNEPANPKEAQVHTPVKLFWDLCGTLGMRRYIVTARPEMALGQGDTNEAFTVRELTRAGIDRWDGLFMMPYTEYKQCRGNAAAYKERVRRLIVARHNEGHPALITIGDQWGDVTAADCEALAASHDPEQTLVGFFDDTAVLGVKLPAAAA
jgi:hypothetical protein